ncbi:hypothetical protein EMIHUDRAFT_211275 [Emiliania huxleyi CCMP1516]|uniref:Right handed beta helix domain-containing protein n=2 Tax=Emiliania huxleyi TaxID=2903 RepID=A0A0D3IWQ9_EMIH1|nr:hypothetical protein EMIHUDRAFT_211275 [Emiliania huxleyi CCMP1516]EOD15694.1 hypothetical protein EMIHUDRAFT_211275 [Emiliania huxleyi CCMP1516]|eukprot:XP_005768123.1 hypothetical protein EMIHUDRAFT_211275 [Emiliania huxleyi CCMP1516]
MLRDGGDAGVLVHEEGRGCLVGNNVHSNATYGVAALNGGCPAASRNWLHGRRQGGLLVDDAGAGEYFRNEVEGNAKSGVTLRGAIRLS